MLKTRLITTETRQNADEQIGEMQRTYFSLVRARIECEDEMTFLSVATTTQSMEQPAKEDESK